LHLLNLFCIHRNFFNFFFNFLFTVVADSAPINPLVNSAAQGIIAKLRPRAVKAATTVAKGRKKRNFESKDDRVNHPGYDMREHNYP